MFFIKHKKPQNYSSIKFITQLCILDKQFVFYLRWFSLGLLGKIALDDTFTLFLLSNLAQWLNGVCRY